MNELWALPDADWAPTGGGGSDEEASGRRPRKRAKVAPPKITGEQLKNVLP